MLGEADGAKTASILERAELVLTSDLTLIECERVLIRTTSSKALSEADAVDRRAALRRAAEHWVLLRLDDEIRNRSKLPFPAEPVRTLDAIHLASALIGRGMVPGLLMLSLDRRVRENAAALGFDVLPD
ncbi:MAG: PIN domain-containing protein [Gemmatimonadetes bacterium]|nr:PIN domain-containing protein [Gemmatimonadota bacterium]